MGRTSIYTGVVFAVVGLLAGVYALSLGPAPNLPTPALLLLCPTAFLVEFDRAVMDFLWLLAFLNSILYGAIGIFLGKLFHVDNE